MAALSTAFLLVCFFLSLRLNAAEKDDDDVTAYQQTENDVITQSPSVKSNDVDGVKAKYLNVLERKLKTFPRHQKQIGWAGKAPQQPPQSGAIEAKRRSWAENSMYAWGKRRPGSIHPVEPRFKRSAGSYMRGMSANPTRGWGDEASLGNAGRVASSEDFDDVLSEEEEDDDRMDHRGRGRPSQQKRRWSEHSMNAWGKRMQTGKPIDGGDDEGLSGHQPPLSPPPKGRSSNEVYFVLLQKQHHRNGVSKRNWATNTMDVWGKRSTPQNSFQGTKPI